MDTNDIYRFIQEMSDLYDIRVSKSVKVEYNKLNNSFDVTIRPIRPVRNIEVTFTVNNDKCN